jgi:hypothetical protein
MKSPQYPPKSLRFALSSLSIFLSLEAMGHDLPGIDAERLANERWLATKQAALNQTGTAGTTQPAQPAPAQPKGAAAAAPKKLSATQLTAINKVVDRNHAIAILGVTAARPTAVPARPLPGLPTTQKLESVIFVAKTWGPGTTLKVCFIEDSDAGPRQAIALYASEWTKWGSVKFDFGPPPSLRTCLPNDGVNIRITFRTDGYAAYVGKDALAEAAQNEPTVFLKDFDSENFTSDVYKGIVIHEFGHVLGFAHEHQSPATNCQSQFDIDAIKRAYGWDDSQVEVNILRINISHAFQVGPSFTSATGNEGPIDFTKYDPKSVMHYALPVEIFKQPPGSCFIAEANNELSDLDKKGMSFAYPNITTASFNAKHNAVIDQLAASKQVSTMERQALVILKR